MMAISESSIEDAILDEIGAGCLTTINSPLNDYYPGRLNRENR